MRIVYCICFVIVFFSCEKKDNGKKNKPYVISEVWNAYEKLLKNHRENGGKDNYPPPPPRMNWGYGYQNFIIDDSLNVFYYQFQPQFVESCIPSYDDDIPYFQDIRPNLLIQIPKESLVEFVKLNFKKGLRNKVKIASQKDTLNSKEYFDLIKAFDKYLDKNEDRDMYAVFATTQEEDSVLYYFKNKKDYYPEEIKWDKKKIRFSMPKID